MTKRLARLALAAAAFAALAAPASAAQTLPEECQGTTYRCVQYVKDYVCPSICV